MRKLFICTPLGTFKAFCYMFIVFLGGYNSLTTEDIKLKFSAFLSCVEVTNCVKYRIPRYKDFKVGTFRISPIGEQFLNLGFDLGTLKTLTSSKRSAYSRHLRYYHTVLSIIYYCNRKTNLNEQYHYTLNFTGQL